jgi:hypothetical protein
MFTGNTCYWSQRDQQLFFSSEGSQSEHSSWMRRTKSSAPQTRVGGDGADDDEDELGSEEAVHAIRRQNISKATQSVYLNALVRFLDWAEEKDRPYLVPEFRKKFLTGKAGKNRKELKKAILEADLKHPPMDMKDFNVVELGKYLNVCADNEGKQRGISALKTPRSAILWMIKLFNLPISQQFKDELGTLWKGFARTNARKVAEGKGELKVGKDHISREDYFKLCALFLSKGMLFGHLATVLGWNLMARVGNVMLLLVDHIRVLGDHLDIHFAHGKTDQEGNLARIPRAVFANPLKPEVCPVLALALHFLVRVEHMAYLFDGNHQYDRYIKDLKTVLEDPQLAESLRLNGTDPKNVATHTLRKGSATDASAASTSGPTDASVESRGGWHQNSGSQHLYMKHNRSADACLGRHLAGLPIGSEQFSILPPHFLERNDNVARALDLAFGRSKLREGVGEFLLASVVYHYDFLVRTLPSNHEVFASTLFTTSGILESLKPLVHTGTTATAVMHPTGVPIQVTLIQASKELERSNQALHKKLDEIAPTIVEKVTAMLEERAVESGNVTMQGLKQTLVATLQELRLPLSAPEQRVEPPPPLIQRRALQLHMWGGKLHRVPQDFQFADGTVAALWNLWWLGDLVNGYPPLRMLESSDMSSSNLKKRLSELKGLMQTLERTAKEKGVYFEGDNPTTEQVLAMYNASKSLLPSDTKTAKGRRTRVSEHKWRTVVNQMRSGVKKRRLTRRRSVASDGADDDDDDDDDVGGGGEGDSGGGSGGCGGDGEEDEEDEGECDDDDDDVDVNDIISNYSVDDGHDQEDQESSADESNSKTSRSERVQSDDYRAQPIRKRGLDHPSVVAMVEEEQMERAVRRSLRHQKGKQSPLRGG